MFLDGAFPLRLCQRAEDIVGVNPYICPVVTSCRTKNRLRANHKISGSNNSPDAETASFARSNRVQSHVCLTVETRPQLTKSEKGESHLDRATSAPRRRQRHGDVSATATSACHKSREDQGADLQLGQPANNSVSQLTHGAR
jgi:hypothetical protein